MKDYNYYDDMIYSMDSIDGIWPYTYSLLYDDTIPRVVKVKVTDEKVFIYPDDSKTEKKELVIELLRDNIEYYKEEGEIYREQIISGGGSTGINIPGAIIGDLIAGPAGMIIGGQRKVNEIKSETITHDTRKVELSYFIDKKTKIRKKYIFNYEILQFFNDNIPEKEYSVVDINRKKKLMDNNTDNLSIKDKLKELNGLLEEKLITQDEYNERKKKILDRL